jgi:NitT/TauT family transport system permease protein
MSALDVLTDLSAAVQMSPGQAPKTDAANDPAARRRRDYRRRKVTVQVLRVAVAIVWIGSWELTTRLGIVDKFFFGQPSGVAQQMYIWLTQGTALGPLWQQVAVTMEETVLGFLLGAVMGIVAGVLLGSNRLLADVFSPYLKAFNSIPRVVLGALFAISLGLDLRAKVATAAVLVFFVVFFNAFQGVREVDRNLIANARILGANRRRLTTEIILPSAMSWIIASLHISFGLALVGAVVGELFGATQGVGELIYNAEHNFDANGVFAGMLLLAVVALVAESLITTIEGRLIKWRPDPVTDMPI